VNNSAGYYVKKKGNALERKWNRRFSLFLFSQRDYGSSWMGISHRKKVSPKEKEKQPRLKGGDCDENFLFILRISKLSLPSIALVNFTKFRRQALSLKGEDMRPATEEGSTSRISCLDRPRIRSLVCIIVPKGERGELLADQLAREKSAISDGASG
jgi:hypothetical protein